MTETTNLLIQHFPTSPVNPDIPINAAWDQFDASIAGRLVHDMASDADYTLDDAADPPEWSYPSIEVIDTGGVLTAPRNITYPAQNGPVFVFRNSTAQDLTVKVALQTGVTVRPGETALLMYDGTDIVAVSAGGGLPHRDDEDLVRNATDDTKLLRFDLAGIATATTRTATWPDKDGTVAMLSDLPGSGAGAGDFDEDAGTTTGLTWGWQSGTLRVDATIYPLGAGTIGLAASATNYVELDPLDQTMKVNQAAFTAGRIPIREITTDASTQTSSLDRRAWVLGRQVFYTGLTEALSCDGQQVRDPELRSLRETAGSYTLSAGTLTLDLATGVNFAVLLDQDVTSVAFANAPAGAWVPVTIELAQDATGGRTVGGWPAAVKWPGGTVPTITAAADAVDVLTGYTRDGGATIRLGRAFEDSR